jgi:hypothetical protein
MKIQAVILFINLIFLVTSCKKIDPEITQRNIPNLTKRINVYKPLITYGVIVGNVKVTQNFYTDIQSNLVFISIDDLFDSFDSVEFVCNFYSDSSMNVEKLLLSKSFFYRAGGASSLTYVSIPNNYEIKDNLIDVALLRTYKNGVSNGVALSGLYSGVSEFTSNGILLSKFLSGYVAIDGSTKLSALDFAPLTTIKGIINSSGFFNGVLLDNSSSVLTSFDNLPDSSNIYFSTDSLITKITLYGTLTGYNIHSMKLFLKRN